VMRQSREAVQRAEQVSAQTRALLDRGESRPSPGFEWGMSADSHAAQETAPMAPPVALPEAGQGADAGAPEPAPPSADDDDDALQAEGGARTDVHDNEQAAQAQPTLEEEAQDDGWSSLLIANPPFRTDGRGKVVFASANAEAVEEVETGREGRRRRCARA
jgi:hypothetical protein